MVVVDQVGHRDAHDRRGLEPVRPPAAVDQEPLDVGEPHDRRVVGRHVAQAAPRAHQLHPSEHREELERVRGRDLEEIQRGVLRVRRVRLDLRADQDLASVRLRDVDVQGGRDEDHVQERLQRLRHERLQRMGDDRRLDPGHPADLARPARDGGDHGAGRDVPAVRPNAGDATALDVHARHLGALVHVHAHAVGHPRVRPHDGVVADHAPGRVVERGHDREVGMAREVELRTELRDLVRVDHPGVDAEESVHLRALVGDDHGALGVRERQVTLLREQEVVVELLRELLVQPERLLVEGHALGRPVVRTNDRGVAAGSTGAHVALVEDGDVTDAALGELVRDREPVGAAADDHDVVGVLQLVMAPHPPGPEISDRVHQLQPSARSACHPTGAPPSPATTPESDSQTYRAYSVAT